MTKVTQESFRTSVKLEGSEVIYNYPSIATDIRIDVRDILIIGESTNGEGPGGDDWFLNLVVAADRWYDISVCSEGFEDFLDALSRRLAFKLVLSLGRFTECHSVVKSPGPLQNRPLFEYRRKYIFWATQTLTAEVISYISSRASDSSL